MKLIAKMFLVSSVAYVLNANAGSPTTWGQNCNLNITGDCDGKIYIRNNATHTIHVDIYHNDTNIKRIAMTVGAEGIYGWKDDENKPTNFKYFNEAAPPWYEGYSSANCLKGDGQYTFVLTEESYYCTKY